MPEPTSPAMNAILAAVLLAILVAIALAGCGFVQDGGFDGMIDIDFNINVTSNQVEVATD